jgi:hypothetical protein
MASDGVAVATLAWYLAGTLEELGHMVRFIASSLNRKIPNSYLALASSALQARSNQSAAVLGVAERETPTMLLRHIHLVVAGDGGRHSH